MLIKIVYISGIDMMFKRNSKIHSFLRSFVHIKQKWNKMNEICKGEMTEC